ncbi:s-adenosylmethionine mitochondrial carrier protein-like protein [Microdochium trichocladiopsis]|uniref:S-adenosylmethionine mitochondrial carrier protein-like protein n=1 Tax=Microdochium trichocladiopsis TaxID=1682393 RepID=A0A9P8XW14_9PEZI|nr:s-adenosylmethionine mitochondrial carrier protein-like protein [Microdochium trichocladiopsis]KAH7021213.1 s-adenosylmethionine mitochondrial carrier protein-like protein [Microdochium trichocladiopsis]
MSPNQPQPSFVHALLAGGVAGTTVDLSLFPLDTLKTRMQSSEGFFASGGFKGIYRGVGSAVVGSAPGAAFFFCTYEGVKDILARRRRERESNIHLLSGGLDGKVAPVPGWSAEALEHMAAASLGEVAACAVRVPTEVVKQRAQAGLHSSSLLALTSILSQRSAIGLAGVWRELYRGWGITVMREVPFTVIQFPLWEALKSWSRQRKALELQASLPSSIPGSSSSAASAAATIDVSAAESALYGSASGAVAAGITTPLDVLKTRVMLSKERQGVLTVLKDIYRAHGVRPFFAGIGPRIMWISAGGAIFLGSYQWAVNTLSGSVV